MYLDAGTTPDRPGGTEPSSEARPVEQQELRSVRVELEPATPARKEQEEPISRSHQDIFILMCATANISPYNVVCGEH
jgi:hypothetical protein